MPEFMDFFAGACYATVLSGTMGPEERDELQRVNDVCDASMACPRSTIQARIVRTQAACGGGGGGGDGGGGKRRQLQFGSDGGDWGAIDATTCTTECAAQVRTVGQS